MKYPFVEDVLTAKILAKTVPVGALEQAIEEAKRDNQCANTVVAMLAYFARVSNPSNQTNFKTAEKLLAYCMRLSHWSVFTMANIVIEVECPRDIGRQVLRHRLEAQEFSQRYSLVDELGISFAIPKLRTQDFKNRQNSFEVEETDERFDKYVAAVERRIDAAKAAYDEDIALGVAKETARKGLPEGYTMTRMVLNGTVRQWIHYLAVRDDEGVTQWEHVLLARKIRQALAAELSVIFGAVEEASKSAGEKVSKGGA